MKAMKVMKIGIVICLSLSLGACNDEKVKIENYATQADLLKLINTTNDTLKRINTLKATISAQAIILSTQSETIKSLATKSEANKHDAYINLLKKIDLNSIEVTKNTLISIQEQIDKNKKLAVKDKIKKTASSKKVKVNKATLNVTVYTVNPWGNGYVAVIFTKENGYQTVTKNQSVADGWEVAEIKPNNILFVHRSGKRVSVNI